MESYRYLDICMMLLILLPFTKAFNYQVFKAKPELQNKAIDTIEMTELHSRSVIRCAVQCTNDCACFGFNTIINKCRVYKNCDLGHSVAEDNGWIYFAGKLSLSLSLSHFLLSNNKFLYLFCFNLISHFKTIFFNVKCLTFYLKFDVHQYLK